MNRLAARAAWAREGHRLSLVGYLPAGFPSRAGFRLAARAAFDAGIDALEVALPNPPLPLDGPLIREAGQVGRAQVRDARDALCLATQARAHDHQAVVALAYRHAVEEVGTTALIETCLAADADALLMPEHSFADQLDVARDARAAGLEQVLFLHLEDDLHLLRTTGVERPLIYLQSADLQTGGPFDAAKARERLAQVRAALGGYDAYVLVGFGVRGPDEVGALTHSSADGVVVGTSMVAAAAGSGAAGVRGLIESIQPRLPQPARSETSRV